MMYRFLYAVLLFQACSGSQNISNPLIFKNKTLEKVVSKYAQSLDSTQSHNTPITLSINLDTDTANIAIVDALPDLTIGNYYGATEVGNHFVYVVCTAGNNNGFFTTTSRSEIPPELKEKIQRQQDGHEIPTIREPQAWFLRFKSNVLIDYIPKAKIDSLLPGLIRR